MLGLYCIIDTTHVIMLGLYCYVIKTINTVGVRATGAVITRVAVQFQTSVYRSQKE